MATQVAMNFKERLQAAVDPRHQANHPIVAKWAAGEIKDETVAGIITEVWYWISRLIPEALFSIAANGPQDVVEMEMENYAEELDPDNPHPDLIVRFAKACGIPKAKLDAGRGLPTTEAWLEWELHTARFQPWMASVAGVHVASEAQEPKLFNMVLPAMRNKWKFSEHDLEFWWLHATADIEHGGAAFDILDKHCKTKEQQDLAVAWAAEGARRKWLFWDGINLHYELGYKLQ
ncbi:MAG: TenA family transcriptional regulator [Alphaproteobacteria bacterium]